MPSLQKRRNRGLGETGGGEVPSEVIADQPNDFYFQFHCRCFFFLSSYSEI